MPPVYITVSIPAMEYSIISIIKNSMNQIHFFPMRLRFSSTDFSEKKRINPTMADRKPIGLKIQPYTKILPNEKNKCILKYLLSAKHTDDEIQKKANIPCNTIEIFNHLSVFMRFTPLR